jgi:Bacterial Ig-like domain
VPSNKEKIMSKKSTDNPVANNAFAPAEVIVTAKNAQRTKNKTPKGNLKKPLFIDEVENLEAKESNAVAPLQVAELSQAKTMVDVPVSDLVALPDEAAIAALPSEYVAIAALPESGALAWANLAGVGGSALSTLPAALGALGAAAGLSGGGGNSAPAAALAPANNDVKNLPTLSANLDPKSDSASVGDKLTNNARPTLKGSATPGAKISIAIDTNGDGITDITITTVADANGAWSATPAVDLPDGPMTASVVATDSNGQSTAPSLVTLVVDTTIAPPNPVLALRSDTGNIGDNSTTIRTPTIQGAGAAPGDKISVSLDTNGDGVADMTLETIADAQGKWSVVPTSALPVGKINATFIASDDAGNISTPATLILNVAPMLTAALSPASDSGKAGDLVTNDTTPTITGVGIAGDTVKVISPTGEVLMATVGPNGIWSVTPLNALPEGGPQEFKATTTDAAGNTSSAIVALTIDTIAGIAPTVTIVDDLNNDEFLNTAELGTAALVNVAIGLPPNAAVGDPCRES